MPTKNPRGMAHFTLRLRQQSSAAAGAPYQATILESPFPKMGGATDSPLPPEEVQSLRSWAERAVNRAQQAPETKERPVEAETVAAKGRQLYQAWPAEARAGLQRSCDWAQRHGRILQVGLEFDEDAPDGATLADLPWEWLCLLDGTHLGLACETPIARIVSRPAEGSPPAGVSLQRVLLVESTAGIGDMPPSEEDVPLDMEQIRSALQTALPQANIDTCPARLEALQTALRAQPYQVVCFLGHGDFEPISGQGRLLFEDQDGNPQPLNAAQVAALLTGIPSLQLALLLACQSGRRIASRLVRQGIPAVVAMQFPISDRAAAVFVRGFASALVAGDPAPVAATEGRRVLRAAGFALEWGTPVCYLPRAAAPKLSWADRLEEAAYNIMAGLDDLLTPVGMARLLKAGLLLLLQRGLWLPWENLPGVSSLPAALSLWAGCVTLPLLMTLFSRSPRHDPLMAHLPPGIQRIMRRYQLTGAYLGYFMGLAVDLLLLALPLYLVGLGDIFPPTLRPLVWWLASLFPLLLAYMGLRRVARGVAAAYRTPSWTGRDTFILLGMPLIVAPAVALWIVTSGPLWLDRSFMFWLLGIAGAAVAGITVWQGRRKDKS